MKRYKCPVCGKEYKTRIYCIHNRTLFRCTDRCPSENSGKGKIDSFLDLMNNYREVIILVVSLVLSLYSFYLVCKVFQVIW